MNAFAMTGPVHQLEAWLAAALGTRSDALILGLMFAAGLVVGAGTLVGWRGRG